MTIAFVGLGIMGKPMAKNLLKAGYQLKVYDVVAQAVQEVVAAGAKAATSSADAAKDADIIVTMLPNSPHVKTVVMGENGVLEAAKSGSMLIDMSSISPIISQEVGAACAAKGVRMLDAPVSGGEPKAIDGTLAIMVGGVEADFEEAKDLLLKMGASAVYCGNLGAGNVTKLSNQIIVALNIAAVSEALTLATKAGVDPEKVYQAIRGGLAGSTVLDAKAPMMLAGNFKPGFRIELHIKDLLNVMDTAHEVGSPAPLTAQVLEMMEWLKAGGKQTNDHSGLVEYYENLANVKVRS